MRFHHILFLTLPILCHSYGIETAVAAETHDHTGSGIGSPELTIQKRSGGGSFDFIRHIKTGLIGGVGRASAAVASGSSVGSGSFTKSHESTAHGNSIDPWSLKKSVLNTLFQAVKAITGGVTAIKGQLIKGSGYAISAGGQLIAASGDKISDVGSNIVSSAQLVPPAAHPSASHPLVGKFGGLSSTGSISKHPPPPLPSPVVDTHTSGHGEITFDIPSGHASYGPPSKSPSFSSTSYLPTGGYSGGGQYASFEGPPSVGYLPPSKYGVPLDGFQQF